MKKIFIFLIILVCIAGSVKALTYGELYYKSHLSHAKGGNTQLDPLYLTIKEVNEAFINTPALTSLKILESTGATYWTKFQGGNQSANLTYTLPTAYPDSSGYVLACTDAGVLSWSAVGATTVTDLDTAYNGGNTIDVDGSALTFTVSDTDNNPVMTLVQNDSTNNPKNLTLTNAGTGNTIDIQGTGGKDIEGTDDSWNISYTGTLTCVGITASGDITAENITAGTALILDSGATISNAPDSEITFTDAGEDLAFDMDSTTNVVGLKSSTGVTGLAMGTIDDLSGIGTLAFDAAASTITLATDGAAQDLTIQVTGAQNSSLIFNSAGTAADAMILATSAGGMDLTVAGAAANEDLDLTSNTSINLTANEAAADQIKLSAAGTVAGNAINIATTDGGILIAAAGAANGDFAVTSADDASITATDDLTLNGGSSGSILNFGTNTHGNVIHIGDNDTTADTITIGSAKDTTSIAGIATTFGSTGTTSATTLQSGTGDISITSTDAITMTSAGAFNIGADAVAQTITIGNITGASSLALKCGTGNFSLEGVVASTITIGKSDQTGTMKFGESTGALEVDLATGNSNKTVNLGTGTGVSTINIATGGTGAKTITIGDAASTGTTNIKAGSGGINMTGSVIRTAQQYVQTISYCKVGTTAGWAVPAASDAAHVAALPQSQTASTLIIPITIPLKVGYTITGWTINGQIDSGGNAATLDARLYKHTEATTGYANAAIGSGMTQLSKTADYKVVEGESGLSEVVAADESYYLLVTGTTAATTDIEIAGITVTVSEI